MLVFQHKDRYFSLLSALALEQNVFFIRFQGRCLHLLSDILLLGLFLFCLFERTDQRLLASVGRSVVFRFNGTASPLLTSISDQ